MMVNLERQAVVWLATSMKVTLWQKSYLVLLKMSENNKKV